MFDPKRIAAEVKWLKDHPHFEQKPASVEEFCGEGYLDIASMIRPGLMKALKDIFGEEVLADRIAKFEKAMVTGGIGIGKTTFASIALPYMCHWILCLRDPQGYFGLLPGSRIAFMQMSTSEKQALEVIFGDLKARVEHSLWFQNNYPPDPAYTKQMRFSKDIWILPGDSSETTFEGYNILAGILDEMDSHKTSEQRGDYAENGYNTIESRIASRFPVFGADGEEAGHRGLIICIGQMKKGNGFADKKYREFKKDPKAYVMRMTIWESFGWAKYTRRDGTRNSFWYDTKRKRIIPSLVAGQIKNEFMIEIPNAYKAQFENNPEKALKDLAGIPPKTSDAFISLIDRVEECVERWTEKHGDESPVEPEPTRAKFTEWFKANGDPRKRHCHLDIAYSAEGDAAGFAMGYVESVVEIEGEKKPHIVIDCLVRVKASPGTEILISDLRRIIYELKEDRGFRIYSVSMDGFQSTDTQQQLRKKRYRVDYLSIDKSTLPYEDLRDAIYERRLDFPPYVTYLKKGDGDLVQIAVQELTTLQHAKGKVDHPPDGSKDVADAMAGVVHTLMGDRVYRKGVSSMTGNTSDLNDSDDSSLQATGTDSMGSVLQFPGVGGRGLQAPLPPSVGGLGLSIPSRLTPKRER
jgi:hypothetical protein